jgi:hypothetical protein
MEQVTQILRALLLRALSEHGAQHPTLTDVLIERAHGRPQLGVAFANGYRAWAPLSPADCYAFCERNQAWDVASLRAALLREGQRMYLQMREEHLLSRRRLRQRQDEIARTYATDGGATLLERLRREADAFDHELIWQQRTPFAGGTAREAEIRARQPDAGRRLLQWWAQQREQLAGSFAFLRGFGDIGSKRAQERGLKLLKENLSPTQRQQYERHGFFDVVGGSTGKRYRIRNGRQMNIEQLDKNGRRVCGWCFFPQGSLVAGDIMLAQKVALELYETEALRIANRY